MAGRDADPKASIRAIELAEPLHADGKLDEEVSTKQAPFGELTQVVPKYGAVSKRGEPWGMFDTENIWDTSRTPVRGLTNRAFAVKFNRLPRL